MDGWVNNREAGDLRRYRTHYDVIVMSQTDNTLSMVQLIAWHPSDNRPLSESMAIKFTDA